MDLTVCIGSACHLKGSKVVSQIFEQLIDEKNLRDKIRLHGAFCLKNCQKDVSVSIDGEVFSVSPENAAAFFCSEVLTRLEQ